MITKDYNLPSDFVYEQMVKRLGSIIEGFQDDADGKVIVTQTYVARNKAKIRAVLRAITVPTAVNVICNRFELEVGHRFRLNLLFPTKALPPTAISLSINFCSSPGYFFAYATILFVRVALPGF